MPTEIIIVIISALEAIIVAVLGGVLTKNSKRQKISQDKMEGRAALRADESSLMMSMVSASISLGVATAHALKDGKINGRLEEALTKAAQAELEYNAFIQKIASKHITK